jgi:hypothetical protein
MENHSGSSPKVLRKSIKNQDVKAAIGNSYSCANLSFRGIAAKIPSEKHGNRQAPR